MLSRIIIALPAGQHRPRCFFFFLTVTFITRIVQLLQQQLYYLYYIIINYIIGLVHELVRVHYTHAWLQYIYATVFPLLKT